MDRKADHVEMWGRQFERSLRKESVQWNGILRSNFTEFIEPLVSCHKRHMVSDLYSSTENFRGFLKETCGNVTNYWRVWSQTDYKWFVTKNLWRVPVVAVINDGVILYSWITLLFMAHFVFRMFAELLDDSETMPLDQSGKWNPWGRSVTETIKSPIWQSDSF